MTARSTRALHYFAYGSNLHPTRLERRVDVVSSLGAAHLPDYRLAFNKRGADGSGKGNIIHAPGTAVWGAVYALRPVQAATLDQIEGSAYERVTLNVLLSDTGAELTVYSYRALTVAVDDGLTPFDWYLDYLLHGAVHHALPAHYVDRLRRVSAAPDTDEERAHRERSLLGVGSRRLPQGG